MKEKKYTEKYTNDELRFIYKDAKYNWSNTASLDLVEREDKKFTLHISKNNYGIKLYVTNNLLKKNTVYACVNELNSFAYFMKEYNELIEFYFS